MGRVNDALIVMLPLSLLLHLLLSDAVMTKKEHIRTRVRQRQTQMRAKLSFVSWTFTAFPQFSRLIFTMHYIIS